MNDARMIPQLALCVACALAPSLAVAQLSDEFASDSGARRPFANVPEEHPNCAGPVHEFWAKTDELGELFEQRKRSVNPEATELTKQINETAKERGEIGDEIIDCLRNDVIDARPPLEGRVEQLAPFELRAEHNEPAEPDVLREQTPQLDPRESGVTDPSGDRVVPEVTGKLLTPGGPTDGAPPQGADPSAGGGPGTGPGGETYVELDVSGRIVGTGGGTGPGGTVVNDITRNYAFAKGLLEGVNDSGQETGRRLAQLMLATSYIVVGDYSKARDVLGLIPGQSVTIADLEKDLEAFSDVINGDPEGTSLEHSFQSGRTVSKKLADIFTGKYLIDLPPLQPPMGGFPNGAGPTGAR